MRHERHIVYDDYNSRIPADQDVVGGVTTQYGNPALRHGNKLLIIFDT